MNKKNILYKILKYESKQKKGEFYMNKYNNYLKMLQTGGNGIHLSVISQISTGDEFDRWNSIAVLPNGNFVVSDIINSTIHILQQDGTILTNIGFPRIRNTMFNKPSSIAILPNGNLAICDSENHRIKIIQQNGTDVTTFGSYGSGIDQFNNPSGIVTLPNGNLAICDTENDRIKIVQQDGTVVNTFGSRGKGINQFNSPTGIAVFPDGKLAICDMNNYRIKIVKQDGTIVNTFGSYGSGINEFNLAYGIAILPNGDLAISDSLNDRIKIVEENGTFVTAFGSRGKGINQFDSPYGIATLPNGNLAVCDVFNNKIKILKVDYASKNKYWIYNEESNYDDDYQNFCNSMKPYNTIALREIFDHFKIPYLKTDTKEKLCRKLYNEKKNYNYTINQIVKKCGEGNMHDPITLTEFTELPKRNIIEMPEKDTRGNLVKQCFNKKSLKQHCIAKSYEQTGICPNPLTNIDMFTTHPVEMAEVINFEDNELSSYLNQNE